MTVRNYFDKHPSFTPDGGSIKAIAGVDDALLYSGVPIDATVFDMIKAGRYDEEIPDESMRRLREIGGFCG
jgi:hypothetical protein